MHEPAIGVRFGGFELDVRTGELRKRGVRLKIQDQPLLVLQALMERPGELVTREELRTRIWAHDTFVDFEQGLNRAINKVREVLNDDAGSPRFIETLPRRGYRFVAPVEAAGKPATAEVVSPPPTAIAVLPFANMSGDKENEYFSDGLAEEILNALAQVPGLKVIARTSSFAFRGQQQDITKIAETLRVRTILEGSVRRAGNRIRVAAQLIDASDGTHLWSDRYDRELVDVFAVQDEIAAAITGALRGQLARDSTPVRQYKPNIVAYEACLQGRYVLGTHTAEGMARSQRFFERAISIDPQYPEPHMGLAMSLVALGAEGIRPAHEVIPAVRTMANRTLALDGSNAMGHALLGMVAASYDYDWNEAGTRFRRALAEAPGNSLIAMYHGIYYANPFLGIREGFLESFESAVEQDPLSVITRAMLCSVLNAFGMYDRAAQEAHAALEIENHWRVHYTMAESHAFRGLLAVALGEATEARRLAPWNTRVLGLLAGVLTLMGRKAEAAGLTAKFENMTPFGMVLYHLVLGEIDDAADWYEKSIEQREQFAVTYAGFEGATLKALRDSPRWSALAQRMNLPESA